MNELEKVDHSARIAPVGNRRTPKMLEEGVSNPWYRRLPHYHRRRLGPDGASLEGQGIERHRPWQSMGPDKSVWDRF